MSSSLTEGSIFSDKADTVEALLGEGRGVTYTYVPCLIFKSCHFARWRGGHITVSNLLLYLWYSSSLSQSWTNFTSFATNSSHLCRCFKAMSLCHFLEFNPNPNRVSLYNGHLLFAALKSGLNISAFLTVKGVWEYRKWSP